MTGGGGWRDNRDGGIGKFVEEGVRRKIRNLQVRYGKLRKLERREGDGVGELNWEIRGSGQTM